MNGFDGNFTEALDGTGVDREEAGDKAWALERLIEHGFPVPDAVLVRAAAYQAVVADPHITRLREDWRAAPSSADGDAAVLDAFLAAPLPRDLEQAVSAAIATLLPDGPLVVRPSVTSGSIRRDPGGTVLGVEDVAAALRAIRRCWATLWLDAVSPMPGDGNVTGAPAMAVIVQRQIESDVRGTLITRDPHGDGTTMRLVAEHGGGTGRVVHQIQRADLAVIARRETTPPFLEDLGRLGLRIERRFGEPQEIAWALRAGSIWILSSYAINDPSLADHHRFDTAAPRDDVFSPQGVAEMLPGVLDPLSWSINGAMVEHGLRAVLCRNRAEVPAVGRPLVGRFHGRAALNLSALGVAVAAGAGSGTVERAYLGTDAEPAARTSRPRASVGGLLRAWRERRRVEDEVAVLTTATGCLPLLTPDLSRLPSGALITYRRRLRDLAERGVVAELAASTAATTAYHNLEALLQRWLGAAVGTVEAQRITAGGLAGSSVGPRRVSVLSEIVARHRLAGGVALSAGTPVDATRSHLLAQGTGGLALVAEVEEAARAFGSVAIYAGPTFDEDPLALWRLVAAAAGAPREAPSPATPRVAVDRAIGAHATTRSWRTLRILTGQLVDVLRRILYRLAADAVHYLALREEAKWALLALGGMERRAILEAATRLVRSGHLDRAGDVGLLEDAELDQMLLGGEPVGRLTLELRRAADAAARTAGPLPRSFVGSPDTARPQRSFDAVLRGWAASPGVVTGRVRRLHSVADGDDLEPGEIIVAVTTDPTWTPLFLRAGGVVLEQGGPLSHAAIVARELGLPAVLSVDGAMNRLPPGSSVTVDGTTGVITPAAILEEVEV